MTEPTTPQTSLSKEERAFVMRHVWEALLAPAWTKDDLIDLGKAIFAKTPLKSLDEKLFVRLFPHLLAITDHLGIAIQSEWMAKMLQTVLEQTAMEQTLLANHGPPPPSIPVLTTVPQTAPTAPVLQVAPSISAAPTIPATTATPVAPAAPAAPAAPTTPATSTTSAAPATPAAPTAPAAPTTPTAPEATAPTSQPVKLTVVSNTSTSKDSNG